MGLFIPFWFVLAAAFCLWQGAQEYIAAYTPNPALVFTALQTHMPTKQGNVPHLQPEEPTPIAQPKTKLDPDQLQREARELLELSQSLQGDIDSVNHGLHPNSLRKNSVSAVVQTGLLASPNLVETTALRTATALSAGIDVAGARQQHRPPDLVL